MNEKLIWVNDVIKLVGFEKMNRLYTILIIFFLAASSASGQLLKYEVVKGTKKLGDMIVERRSNNHYMEYHVKSKVVFRLLFSFTIDYESYSEYVNNELEKETTTSKLNGTTQKSSTIVRNGIDYTHTQNDVSSTVKGPITYSVGAIYHEEPDPGQQVYSPQFGRYLTFEEIDDHVYKMESPDGVNVYTYMNGICTEVKVSRDFAKFYFKMAPETFYAVKNRVDSIVGGN